MSFGGAVSFWTLDNEDNARAAGDFNFNGQATGMGLADFLIGQTSLVRHGAPGLLLMNQWYLGAFAQDTWRLTDRVTLNAGLRWKPNSDRTCAMARSRISASRTSGRGSGHSASPMRLSG